MDVDYKDKTASLIVFGIFELLGGIGCVLFALFAAVPLFLLPDETQMPQTIVGMLVYVFLAVWLIGVGIGTIRARRWTRVLMLAASWLMLASGVLSMGMMFFVMPECFKSSSLPEGMIGPVLAITYTFLAVVYLLFPGIGVLFYSNRNVRATIEARDKEPSRLERCPLPVLILVLILVLASFSLLALCFMNFALPFFGIIVSGWTGAVVLFCCVGICILLATRVWQLRPAAWWWMLALLLLGTVSQLLTYGRVDIMDYYAAMGYCDEMLLQLNRMDWVNSASIGWMTMVYAVPAVAYLLFIKRYFKNDCAKIMNVGECND